VLDGHFLDAAGPSMSRRLQMGLRALEERMPQHAITMRRLARESRSFRELVRDFTDAQLALERWEQIGMLRDEARIAEYRALVSDLAGEICDVVEKVPPGEPVDRRGG
jgi:hypothetical protein